MAEPVGASSPAFIRRRGAAHGPAGALMVVAALAVAGCGQSSSATSTSAVAPSTSASDSATTSTAMGAANPATSFSAAAIPGLGTVVVDGRGRTVYILSGPDGKNLPCEDATGCTKVWPDLPLPAGVASASAGSGINAALLSTMKGSDGSVYPTYNKWNLYEFARDTGPGTAKGEGIKSFGGTWFALSPGGTPVVPAAATATASPTTAY